MPDPVTYVVDADTDGFKADIDAAAAALAELQKAAEAAKPPLSDYQKAQKAVAEGAKKLREAQKRAADASRAATAEAKKRLAIGQAIAKATRDATKATRAAAAADAKRAQELKTGLSAVLGDQVNTIADVSEAWGTMGLAVVGSAAGGVVALTAMVAVTAATLAGIVALGQGVVDLTREMDGYSTEVSEANDAMDAAGSVASVLKGELATELAPEVERVARLLAAMGLAAADGFDVLAEGSNVGLEALTRLASLGIRPGNELMLTSLEVANALANALGADLPEGIDAWITEQRLANAGLTEFASSVEGAETALGGYLEQVDAIIASQKEETEAAKAQAEAEAELAKKKKSRVADLARAQEKAAAEAAKAAADAAKKQADLFKQQIQAEDELRNIASNRAQEQLSDLEKLEQARNDEIDTINTLLFLAGSTAQAEEQATTARLAVLEEFSQARFNLAVEDAAALKAINDKFEDERVAKAKAADAQRKASAESLRNDLISSAQQASNAIIAGFSEQNSQYLEQQDRQLDKNIAILEMKEKLTDEELQALNGLREKKNKLAKFDFLREKGAALATIGVNTAVAIMNAAASLPPPANIPFIAGAAALGAVQLAIAGGTQLRKAHDGEGLISSFSAPSIQSAEVDRRLLQGESVLNQRATNALGEQGVNALNAGVNAPGGGRQIIMLDGFELARSTVKHMRGDGPLAIAVAGRSPGIDPTFGGR